jgi:hypothetical protein
MLQLQHFTPLSLSPPPPTALPPPFQVGLFDVVARQATPVLVAHLIYTALTIWLCVAYMEFTGLFKGRTIDIWLSGSGLMQGQLALMVAHHMVAVAYYLLTYRACLEFMSPKYTDKAAWVSIAQDRFNLRPFQPLGGGE